MLHNGNAAIKPDAQKMCSLALSVGFECAGVAPASKLEASDVVRAMCAQDRCASFNGNWACPSACGDLAFFQELFASYDAYVVFQSVGSYKGRFDYEWCMDLLALHNERCRRLIAESKRACGDAYFLLAQPCDKCVPCTYPQECPYPGVRWPSMEAAGLLVGHVCRDAGIEFHHGKGKFEYTSCALL